MALLPMPAFMGIFAALTNLHLIILYRMIRILNRTKRIVTTIVATATWIAAAAQPNIIYDNDGTELLLNTYWNGAPLTPLPEQME